MGKSRGETYFEIHELTSQFGPPGRAGLAGWLKLKRPSWEFKNFFSPIFAYIIIAKYISFSNVFFRRYSKLT